MSTINVLLGAFTLIICFNVCISQNFTSNAKTCDDCNSTNADCNLKQGYVLCSCKSGFIGNGLNCTRVVFCDSICCRPGYTWDNTKKVCIDIDECKSSSLYTCLTQSQCVNKNGIYLCTTSKNPPCPRDICNTDQDCVRSGDGDGIKCVDPCVNYQEIDGSHRLYTINSVGRFPTDRYLFGWYRYSNGLTLKEGYVGALKCGSVEPFTLSNHPAVGEGVKSVPLLSNGLSLNSIGPSILVKACPAGYYVYKFAGLLKFEVYCTDLPTTTASTKTTTTSTSATTLTTTTTIPTTTTTPATTTISTTTTPTTTTAIPTTTTTPTTTFTSTTTTLTPIKTTATIPTTITIPTTTTSNVKTETTNKPTITTATTIESITNEITTNPHTTTTTPIVTTTEYSIYKTTTDPSTINKTTTKSIPSTITKIRTEPPTTTETANEYNTPTTSKNATESTIPTNTKTTNEPSTSIETTPEPITSTTTKPSTSTPNVPSSTTTEGTTTLTNHSLSTLPPCNLTIPVIPSTDYSSEENITVTAVQSRSILSVRILTQLINNKEVKSLEINETTTVNITMKSISPSKIYIKTTNSISPTSILILIGSDGPQTINNATDTVITTAENTIENNHFDPDKYCSKPATTNTVTETSAVAGNTCSKVTSASTTTTITTTEELIVLGPDGFAKSCAYH